ncbi:MAG TPA: hypothetical protein VJH37_01805 [Candidatus Nanoarchaeia archaeon]|nr:hypothetical protein [Candidatus Nanoarchaeia archaeon]
MTNEKSATKDPRIFGPGHYEKVGRQMLDQGLEVRVGDELIPYAYEIIVPENFPNYPYDYNHDCKVRMRFDQESFNLEARSFRIGVSNGGQWVFQNYLFTDEGIFVVHDRQVEKTYEYRDGEDRWQYQERLRPKVEQLQEKLEGGKEEKGVMFSLDGSTRFADWNTLTRVERGNLFEVVHPPTRDSSHTIVQFRTLRAEEIPHDGLMIASFGVLGAIVLGGITEKTNSRTLNYKIILRNGAIVQKNYTLGVCGNEYQSFGSINFSGDSSGCAIPR